MWNITLKSLLMFWEMSLSLKNSILLIIITICIATVGSAGAQSTGGSQVVTGDVFGKFYGGGVGSAIQGWAESNPFGINAVLSGPTNGYCEATTTNRGGNSSSSGPSRRVASLNDALDSSTSSGPSEDAIDVDLDREYGDNELFKKLRENASNRCGENDYSISACSGSSKSETDPTGLCWKYVKIGLKEAGVVDSYLSSASAINAHEDGILKNNGFCELNISNSNDAPVGSILVYEWTGARARSKGTRAPEHGHIEVKTGESEYISDYISSEPIDQKDSNSVNGKVQRTFAAAYVPCDKAN